MAEHQKPKAQFSDASFYSKLGMDYHSLYSHDTALIAVVQIFISKLPENAYVLECGPGTGLVAKTIVDGGCRLQGIDMSEGMVSICRERVPDGTFEVADMLEYEAPDEHYDGVVASLSIYELSKEEIVTMTKKWARWMKKSGVLLIGTGDPEEYGVPAEAYDEDGCASGVEAKFVDHIVSLTLFSRKGWKMLLERAGFEVVETKFDRFQPKGDVEVEPRYYIIARKTGSV